MLYLKSAEKLFPTDKQDFPLAQQFLWMLTGLLIEALGKKDATKRLPNLLQIDELEHKSVYYYSLLCCCHNFIGKSCEFITGNMRCKLQPKIYLLNTLVKSLRSKFATMSVLVLAFSVNTLYKFMKTAPIPSNFSSYRR